ncbi:unnamed protein product [Durusdinium trenchii]|uniref:Choline transporter-like protein n=1 Tax=Durusdinium trenchii TaxID=1381693 RepID=A0ABP0QIR5_9DINO
MWGVRSVDGDEEAALARVEALTGSKSSLGGDVPRLARARRRCTDRCCSVVLFAFLFGMWSVYQHALKEGNLAKLTRGFDWTGAICGVDEAVRDKPFLFWCTPNRNEAFTLLDGICVSQCPSSDREIFYCPGRALPFQVKQYLDAGHERQEVVIGMRWNITTKRSYPSTEAFGYCFPTRDLAMLRSVTERTYVFGFTKQVVLAGQGAVESWRFLLLVAVACVAMGYVFLFVIWYSFEKLVYSFLALAHVLLIGAAAGFLFVSFYPEHNFFQTYFSPEASRICAWGCAAISLILWMLFSILCCQGREALAVTIDSVTATCEVITEIPTMLLQPLVHSAFVVFTLLLLVYGFAWILSTGKVVPQLEPLGQSGIQIAGVPRSLEFSQLQWVCIVYWIFGAVWIFEILNALSQFAISHAVVVNTIYQDEESFPMLKGYLMGLCFHLGTIALGGFIIGCLKLVAAFLSFILSQTRNTEGIQGAVAQVLCCCCLCTVMCIERVLSMVNDLVYTDVALHSCGYIEAADNVVRVAASNPLTYAAIKASAITMRVVGVSIIGGCGTFLSYQALSSTELHRQLDLVFQDASTMLVTSNILGTTIALGQPREGWADLLLCGLGLHDGVLPDDLLPDVLHVAYR